MRLLYILPILFLASCTSVEAEKVDISKPTLQKPTPIQVANVKWKVLDNKVCLTTTEGVAMNVQNKDTIRYIKDLQSRLCYLGDDKYCIDKSK